MYETLDTSKLSWRDLPWIFMVLVLLLIVGAIGGKEDRG